MANLVVITFEDEGAAEQVLEALREAEHGHTIRLDDSAVVVKAEDGTVEVKNVVDRGVKVGALTGGLVGLLIGFVVGGPIASLVIGAIGGALGGDLANLGIDQRFIDDVSEGLQPGTSALFVMGHDADPEAIRVALEPFRGEVYYTHLPQETEQALREVLGGEK